MLQIYYYTIMLKAENSDRFPGSPCVTQVSNEMYKNQIGNPCNYMTPCKIPCGSAYYLHDLETIPFGNRQIQPTSGQAVPELVGESYTSLQMRNGAMSYFPFFERTRYREEDLEYRPLGRFAEGDYLAWQYQQPDYQMNFNERLIDTRQVHRDLSVIKGRQPFLYKGYA